jgi:membrane fusion protein (multidrug efflux system)
MSLSLKPQSRLLPLFLSVLLSLGLSGCNGDDKATDKAETEEEQKAPIPVEVVAIDRADIQQTYRSITTLEAENEADVVARSTGILEKLMVEEGDRVTKGQLLAQLDIEQLTLEVNQIEATLNKLKNELNRQEQLFSRKLGSTDSRDRARFEYQSQQAQYQLSKLKLNYASIKAPISGIITERAVKQGNLIRDNDLLFKVVDLNSLVAILNLPERELANVKKQQKVLLQIDALNEQVVIGEVNRIRPSIDVSTGTFRVVATIPNEQQKLKSGMFGKVEVVFDVHLNTLVLPLQAVISQDNRSHVFVVKDNEALQTPVKLGFEHDGKVEIISGLEQGDAVIVTGQQVMKHQTRVEIVTDEVEPGE